MFENNRFSWHHYRYIEETAALGNKRFICKALSIFLLLVSKSLFWGLIFPVSIVLKLIGVDLLKRGFNCKCQSYWKKV